jgi:hypothetical protein
MADVHIPKLEDHTDEPVAAVVAPQRHRGKSIATIALEVVLISGRVFLGLMGEQWRERAHERELAANCAELTSALG